MVPKYNASVTNTSKKDIDAKNTEHMKSNSSLTTCNKIQSRFGKSGGLGAITRRSLLGKHNLSDYMYLE